MLVKNHCVAIDGNDGDGGYKDKMCNMRRSVHAVCVYDELCLEESAEDPCICSGFSTLDTAQNESLSELPTSSNRKY